MDNTSHHSPPRDGYDLPVHDLDSELFYALHVPAIVCILVSFICVITTLVLCLRRHQGRPFFQWTKCDRLIVYLAICDGCFNLPHGTDHLHVTLSRNHPYPETLCHFYAFMTAVFATSQNILVGIIAINIFAMMYFQKKIWFGRYDWILFLVVYGLPAFGGMAAWVFGVLGPNGIICLTDGVKGRMVFILFFTIPLLAILLMNSILYALTWLKISSEIKIIRSTLGQYPNNRRTSSTVAKSMSLFVVVFFIQWWAAGLYGAWGLFGDPPELVTHASVTFTNIGGALNLGVYIVNRRRSRQNSRERNKCSRVWRKGFRFNDKNQQSSDGDSRTTEGEKCTVSTIKIEPHREKTGFLPMRKQRRRSASQ